MAVNVQTEIDINRPRSEVASYASDPDNATSWYQNITSVEWKSPRPLTVGSRVAFVARFLGRRLAYTYEVKELVPGQRFVQATAEGPFPMETTYAWDDNPDGGTRMRLRNRGEPAGFSKLAAPIMASAMRRANQKDLARLKAILEEPEGPARPALLHQPDDLPQLRKSSSEGAARRDAAHRAPRRDAADRDPGHALALAPRHRPPPVGAPVAPGEGRRQPGQRRKDRPVSPVRPGPGSLTPKHRDLMTEHHDLRIFGRLAAAQQHQPAKDSDHDQVEQPDAHEPRSCRNRPIRPSRRSQHLRRVLKQYTLVSVEERRTDGIAARGRRPAPHRPRPRLDWPTGPSWPR